MRIFLQTPVGSGALAVLLCLQPSAPACTNSLSSSCSPQSGDCCTHPTLTDVFLLHRQNQLQLPPSLPDLTDGASSSLACDPGTCCAAPPRDLADRATNSCNHNICQPQIFFILKFVLKSGRPRNLLNTKLTCISTPTLSAQVLSPVSCWNITIPWFCPSKNSPVPHKASQL